MNLVSSQLKSIDLYSILLFLLDILRQFFIEIKIEKRSRNINQIINFILYGNL